MAGFSPKCREARNIEAKIQFTMGAFHFRKAMFLNMIVGMQKSMTAAKVIHWNLSNLFW
jgi:hypothetical protein